MLKEAELGEVLTRLVMNGDSLISALVQPKMRKMTGFIVSIYISIHKPSRQATPAISLLQP